MVKIIDTTTRDGQQSLIATRMTTEDILAILETMDEIGFYAMEVWGGATFDACLRYLNEDPWERIRRIKSGLKKTKTAMLLRGQNLVGYKNYADEVGEEFVEKAFADGVDVFRMFDALNDVRNLRVAVKTAKRVGAEVHGDVVYTISPVHTLEHYLSVAREIAALEVDAIRIKDMAGLLSPTMAYDLV
ncbi:MAG: pyruvate carboxylase subunit B, partial [Candidatus Methanomethylicota archaeon]